MLIEDSGLDIKNFLHDLSFQGTEQNKINVTFSAKCVSSKELFS